MTGRFVTFEGGEGSGKSTQLALLHEALTASGISCIKTREPGGSPAAEKVRKLLVEGNANTWNAEAETLLFYAARLDHVQRLIRPAMTEGKTVLCDRFADSTLVYQGVGKGLPEEYIRSLHHLTLGNFQPDLTLILDIDPAIGLKRAHARHHGETRFEALGLEFHQKIRAGFLALAKAEPSRYVVIDASDSPEALKAKIIDIVRKKFGLLTQYVRR